MDEQENLNSERSTSDSLAVENLNSTQYGYCFNRSDDEDDDYGVYHSNTESRPYSRINDYDDLVNIQERSSNCVEAPQNLELEGADGIQALGKEADEHDHTDGCETSPYQEEANNIESVDFENNGLLWLPPEAEDEEDDREVVLYDDDDDVVVTGVPARSWLLYIC